MRICSNNGWTLAQWKALTEQEKRLWLSWDVRTRKHKRALFDSLVEQKKLTPEAYALLIGDLT